MEFVVGSGTSRELRAVEAGVRTTDRKFARTSCAKVLIYQTDPWICPAVFTCWQEAHQPLVSARQWAAARMRGRPKAKGGC